MKKTIVVLSLLLLIAGGYFTYQWYTTKEQIDPFNVVPDNAVLIIETSHIYNVWEDLKSKKVWENVKAVPSVASLTQKISALDSLLSQENKRDFFEGKKVLASLHMSSGNDFDYVFYIPVNSFKDKKFLTGSLDNIKNQGKYGLEERKFNENSIWSVTDKESKISFSYIIYKNLFIGSFSDILLEDFLRSMDKKKDFFFWKSQDKKPKKLLEGRTTVYVRLGELPSLLSLFSESKSFSPIPSFAEESVLEFNINDRELLLNGFTYAASKNASFISNFKTQQPQQFYLKNYVPNNTSVLYYYGFDEGKALRKSLVNFWEKEDPAYMYDVKRVNEEFKIDIGSLYEDIGKEIGLCFLESDSGTSNKLAFIHSKDSERLFLQMGRIVTVVSGQRKQRLKNEVWEGIKINQMIIEEFPSMLLGKVFEGFPECYFVAIDDYVVLSNNKQNLKDLIKDIEAENVWGKTLSINSSLAETITEFNVGVFANVQKTWGTLLNYATPGAKEELEKNKNLLKGFDFLAVQFSHLNETVLTNIVLTHNLSEAIVEAEEPMENRELLISDKIINRFHLVDAKSGGKNLIFQDSLMVVNMVSSDFKARWKYALHDFIAGDVFTVDIGKDRSWEYVFAAGNKIYAVNTKGEIVKNFPFELSDTIQIENLSVIDYSNTKDYRIVVSDQNGHVYLYNLEGDNLDGWKPKSLNGSIFDKVRHLRIGDKNKDLIVGLQKDGMVHVMNRRGEAYEGFPLSLVVGTVRSMAIHKGKDFEKTLLLVQGEEGEIVTFNLEGKIIKRDETEKILCPDSKRHSFVLLQPEEKGITILSMNSDKLFHLPFNIKNISINYYNFSTKGEFFAIKDQEGRLFLFNRNGKSVINSVYSDSHSDIYYNDRKKSFEMYNLYDNKLEVLEF